MDHSQYIEADDYYDLATEWIKNRNYEKAKDCLKHTLSLNAKFIYAYIDLADIHVRQNDFHSAIRFLIKATKIDPTFDRLYYLIAKYSFMSEDYKSALLNINKALKIKEDVTYQSMREVISQQYREKHRYC